MPTATMFIGYVICSVPALGIAIVSTTDGTATCRRSYICFLPYHDSETGVIAKPSVTEGSTVLCCEHPTQAHQAFIVAVLNYAPGDVQDTLNSRALYRLDNVVSNNDPVFNSVLDQLTETLGGVPENHAHSVDLDALPGDYDLLDKSGHTGLHIGRLLSTLHGSPMAFTDTAGLAHVVRQVGQTLERHTLSRMELSTQDVTVDNIAVTPSEAFGQASGAALKENKDEDTVELINDATVPLYRLQSVSGALADGEERTILGFPADSQEHTSETEPPLLAKDRRSLSGELSRASTLSIQSIKTPDIRGLQQLGYNQGKLDDLLTPYTPGKQEKQEQLKAPSPEVEISDAALNKLVDTLFTADYLDKLCEKLAERGLMVSSKDATLTAQVKGTSNISGPVDNKQEYDLPASLQLEDPVTGRKQTYFATSSFISQEPDGSILICDGYGSEVRLSRGNIYISPALDLFLRPGRDLSAMVPRHQSYNSQDTCTINSSKSIYVRAIQDLKMAGATGEKGVVVLESRATKNTDPPGGLIIRSASNAAFVGTNILVARKEQESQTEGQMVDPRPGVIIIDAGKTGTLYERARAATYEATELLLGALTDTNSSAISINNTQIGIYAKQVFAPTELIMLNVNGAESVSVPRAGEIDTITLATADNPTIRLKDSIAVGGDIICNGNAQINGQLKARVVGSTSELMAKLKDPKTELAPQKLDPVEPNGTVGANVADVITDDGVRNGVYQDYFIAANAFAFPLSYNIAVDMRMPGMVWQTMAAQTASSSTKWRETYIKDINGEETACYPGVEVWDTATISLGGYEEKPLKGEYIINTNRSTK